MKNKKQIIKCYNINYSVEEEDIKDTPYEHRNDLLVNQKIELLKSDLETDNLYKVGSTKEVIIDDDVKLEIEEIIANAISHQTDWLVEDFNWKVEEVKQTPTESDSTLDQFMENDKNVVSSNLKGSK